MPTFRAIFLFFVLQSAATLVFAQRSSNHTRLWQTLSGNAPVVIAKGGFSGIFPDSSSAAYSLALVTSLANVIVWCDVQLTKDQAGICLPDLKLENATGIADIFKNRAKTYVVNGVAKPGWFSVDFTLDDLQNVYLTQGIFSRTDKFDGNLFAICTVEEVAQQMKPPGLWLNIQHDAFFSQHNLSMRIFVLSVSKRIIVNYVSSPEVGFLGSIAARFKRSKTKLVFRFLREEEIEPTTNQTYKSLLKNLTFIKTFASGILVPKNYIWPVNGEQYLQPHTSVVSDAHREGLEVFASDFSNDVPFSYNYSYDPIAEYLSFVDNGNFSVDGVLSDFPITPSEAIDCFSHIKKNHPVRATSKVISHNGASGMYPSCTDLAYKQAVEDGVDYIDCSVQMTQDGIPICLSSINLIDGTDVTRSPFSLRSVTIPDIQGKPGIFSFNLTWKDIGSLKPEISNPSFEFTLLRNPANKGAGKFVSLDDFLTFAKSKPLAGVVIIIEHATFLAQKLGLSVTDAVLDALSKSGYNNHTTQEVIIQSANKSVLTTIKEQSNYKLMYKVDEDVSDIDDSSIEDITHFADIVAISKASVFPDNMAFLTDSTHIVPKLHKFNLSVYVYLFRNEFVSQAWDFFSDPTVEINSFVMGAGIDGVITDFPGTSVAYKRNWCLNKGTKTPIYMTPVHPGDLMGFITKNVLPPAEAPKPILMEQNVSEPPLPPILKKGPSNSTSGPTFSLAPSPHSGHPRIAASVFLSSLSMLLASLVLFYHI